VFPIVGARYKCNECPNFDFCEVCEKNLGDEHNHPMTKHRTPVVRSGCPWKKEGFFGGRKHCGRWGKEQEGTQENQFKNFGGHCRRNPFMKFLKEKLNGMKEFFSPEIEANLENLNLEQTCPRQQTTETKTSVPSDDIVVETVIQDEEKKLYQFLLKEIKLNYDLGSRKDDEILEALAKSKGNIDEAIMFLFQ